MSGVIQQRDVSPAECVQVHSFYLSLPAQSLMEKTEVALREQCKLGNSQENQDFLSMTEEYQIFPSPPKTHKETSS